MRPELQNIENIERYLNQEMTAQEKANFAQELAKNRALQRQMEHVELLKKAVVRQSLKNDIQKFAPKSGFNFTKWSGVVGAGIIVIALGYFLLNKPTETTYLEKSTSAKKEQVQDDEFIENQQDSDTDSVQSANTTSTFKSKFTNDFTIQNYQPERFHGLQTWIKPDVQHFTFDAKKGTTIEGKEGTLIIVPHDAFLDKNGNIVQGNVNLELIEALTMSDMIAYNLATTANGKALSSGGMIYVQPYSDGEKVNINPKRPLYIEIPTDNYDPEMKSWRGVVDNQGDINWENPQDLQKFLVRVDLNQLNFLPPNFENAVHAGMPFRKHQVADKRLVDSLYYGLNSFKLGQAFRIGDFDCSQNDLEYLFGDIGYIVENNLRDKKVNFSQMVSEYQNRQADLIKKVDNKSELSTYEKKCFCLMLERDQVPEKTLNILGINMENKIDANNSTQIIESKSILIPPIFLEKNSKRKRSKKTKKQVSNLAQDQSNPMLNDIPKSKIEKVNFCYIDPLSIKTIKTQQFANTFIATREFETRLQALHKIPNSDQHLMLYVNNLDKNLWEIDAQIADQLTGENQVIFENFAAQKCTNLKDAEIHQAKLTAYYQEKIKQFDEENQAANQRYRDMNQKALQQVQNEISKIRSELSQLNEQKNKMPFASNLTQNVDELLKTNSTREFSFPVRRNVLTSKSSYSTPWFEGGWMNIDAYLKSIDKNSVDVNIAANVGVLNEQFTKVYQCINTLKTMISLNLNNDQVVAKFPSKLSKEGKAMTNTYTIGLQRTAQGKILMAEQKFNPYKTQQIELQWQEVDEQELKNRLKNLEYTDNLLKHFENEENRIQESLKIRRQIQSLNDELAAQKKKFNEIEQELKKESNFIQMLKATINPCESVESKSTVSEPSSSIIRSLISSIVNSPVTKNPQFPGGEIELDSFVASNFKIPSGYRIENMSGLIYITMKINPNGSIGQTSISKSNMPVSFNSEALRIVSIMPTFEPALFKGSAVPCEITLLIYFNLKPDPIDF